MVAAGALIFELRQTDTGARNVHAYYTAQSLEDMHQGTGTSAVQTPVPMSACPNGSFCTLDEFTKLVGPMLDQLLIMTGRGALLRRRVAD